LSIVLVLGIHITRKIRSSLRRFRGDRVDINHDFLIKIKKSDFLKFKSDFFLI